MQEAAEINERLLTEVSIKKISDKLGEFRWTSIFELAVNLPFAIWLAGFAVDHLYTYKFFGPALLLLLLTVGGIFFSSYQLYLLVQVRSSQRVLEAQDSLERLRYSEMLELKLLYVAIPLFSIPFFIVVAKGFLGIDPYPFLFLGMSQVLSYFLWSVVVAIVLVFVLRRYPNRQLRESLNFLKDIRAMRK